MKMLLQLFLSDRNSGVCCFSRQAGEPSFEPPSTHFYTILQFLFLLYNRIIKYSIMLSLGRKETFVGVNMTDCSS